MAVVEVVFPFLFLFYPELGVNAPGFLGAGT